MGKKEGKSKQSPKGRREEEVCSTIICRLLFSKKEFWENKHLVLGMSERNSNFKIQSVALSKTQILFSYCFDFIELETTGIRNKSRKNLNHAGLLRVGVGAGGGSNQRIG
jgi:hypothetical protein